MDTTCSATRQYVAFNLHKHSSHEPRTPKAARSMSRPRSLNLEVVDRSPFLLHSVVIFFTLVFLSVSEAASNNDYATMRAQKKWGAVGLTSWSVDADGRLCSIGVTGERIKGSGEALQTTGDSRHPIGSVTKSMTCTLIAILIEDGLIANGWDATMEQLMPIAAEGSYAGVTLRQLLAMLSGMPDLRVGSFVELLLHPKFPTSDIDFDNVRSLRRATAIAALTISTPMDPPGVAFHYSSWAYIVAGHIIEKITEQTWEEVLVERLFGPLGIYLGTDPSNYTGAPLGDTDPWGHHGDEQQPCRPSGGFCDNFDLAGPAGTFSGPVASVARYLSWHVQCHNGDIPRTDRAATILTQEACQELHQPVDPSVHEYGYGWYCVNNNRFDGLICHHGGETGWHTYNATLAFGMNRVFVAYTNGGSRSNNADPRMLQEVVRSLMWRDPNECDARIPSTVYTTGPPPHVRSWSGARHAGFMWLHLVFIVLAALPFRLL